MESREPLEVDFTYNKVCLCLDVRARALLTGDEGRRANLQEAQGQGLQPFLVRCSMTASRE
jgi:hypothetical protein